MTSSRQLEQIYKLMFDKLRTIQIEDKFDRALEEEKLLTYIGKPDNYFFQRMVDLIFQSSVRGVIWLRYEPEIRKQFANYDVKKVTNYTENDVERMMANPKMFKNRMKIQACIYNAKLMVEISEEYSGFWKFLNSHTIQELVDKLTSDFQHISITNSRAFLRYVGMNVVKPDVNIPRVLYRLGLIDSPKLNKETLKQIQEIGKKMAETIGENVKAVDYVIYQYGAGEIGYVKYAVCSKVPKCSECPLTKFCKHFVEVVSNR